MIWWDDVITHRRFCLDKYSDTNVDKRLPIRYSIQERTPLWLLSHIANLRHLVSWWLALHLKLQYRIPQRVQEYVPHDPHTEQKWREGNVDGPAAAMNIEGGAERGSSWYDARCPSIILSKSRIFRGILNTIRLSREKNKKFKPCI
jgi:hypothetical protein